MLLWSGRHYLISVQLSTLTLASTLEEAWLLAWGGGEMYPRSAAPRRMARRRCDPSSVALSLFCAFPGPKASMNNIK